MDLRVKRTEMNIINAFIELRAKKSIEKITIQEITQIAMINKTTFYRHYADIYALSDKIEDDLIAECLAEIDDIDLLSKNGIPKLSASFMSKSELFNIIFSGTRQDIFVHKIHDSLLERIFRIRPEYRDDMERKVLLSATIYGNFHAYLLYKDSNYTTLMNGLSKIVEVMEE